MRTKETPTMLHLLMVIATAVVAPAQTQPAPDAQAQAEASPPVAQAAPYSVETTPVQTLEADPAAKAAVIKHFPTLFSHPAYAMIKSMPLKAIAPYSQGAITDEKLAALQADLDALNP